MLPRRRMSVGMIRRACISQAPATVPFDKILLFETIYAIIY